MAASSACVLVLDILLFVLFAQQLRRLDHAQQQFFHSPDGYWRFYALGDAEDAYCIVLSTPFLGGVLARRLRCHDCYAPLLARVV